MITQPIKPSIARSRLSAVLLRRIMLVVFCIGALISGLQIARLAVVANQQIDDEARQLLGMFAASASQSIIKADPQSAAIVVNGLLGHPAVCFARLEQTGQLPLAEQLRPLHYFPMRYLTDWLFTAERQYSLELGAGQLAWNAGQLDISLDTASYGQGFIRDAGIVLLSALLGIGLLAACVFLLLRKNLTHPLSAVLRSMDAIDPEHPGHSLLSIDPLHENNELGGWINSVNRLLRGFEQAEQSLEDMSRVDFLTGMPNRLALQGRLDGILTEAEQSGKMVAVMCIGFDGFKGINERYSFQQGDWILKSFAQRISNQLLPGLDSVFRLAGDQFVFIHAGMDNSYQAAVQAQKILFLLQQPFEVPQPDQEDVVVQLSATIGITLYPGDAENSEMLLQNAEQSMRLAKMSGRNRYQFYIASIDQQLRERRRLEVDLDKALAKRELHLVYQAQVELESGKVVGAEALLRWRRESGELIPPDTFIPLAEQTGAIIKIGEWVLESACQQLRDWLDVGWKDFRLAVNLSAVQLLHPGLIPAIERIMTTYRVPPDSLELEVTETSLMQDVETAGKQLLALRQLGITIAIDDFGTGHSSLAYLKRLPLDKIKIDRSFVQDMHSNNDDATIVRSIVQLSHSLQLKVLAEGVETRETEQLLLGLGCDEGQGYFYSRPVTAEALLDRYGSFSG